MSHPKACGRPVDMAPFADGHRGRAAAERISKGRRTNGAYYGVLFESALAILTATVFVATWLKR